jgi:lipopolysaccharide biosynthesis regulator YciM
MLNSLITGGIVAVFAAFLYWLLKRRKKSDTQTPYLDALHLLLDGNQEEAFEKLKRTVRDDTDNIMAYIKLGDIFREKGFPIRASKIHRNLLLRTTLTEKQNEETLFHLSLDYRASGLSEKAIEMAERLAQRDKKGIEVRKLLLELYEDKEDWDKAFFMRQGINKWVKKNDQHILALYKVNAGRDLAGKGSERQARIRFREALKLDRLCVPAAVCLGDSYMRERRFEDALKVWKDLASRVPSQAHVVLDRLNDVLYNLGRYGELETLCEEIIATRPDHPGAYFKLMELYEKQGKTGKALELGRLAYEAGPDRPSVRRTLVRFLERTGKKEEALETALAMLGRDSEKSLDFRCGRCGYESGEMFWRCPKCRQWTPAVEEKT